MHLTESCYLFGTSVSIKEESRVQSILAMYFFSQFPLIFFFFFFRLGVNQHLNSTSKSRSTLTSVLTSLEQVPLTWEKNALWCYHLKLCTLLTWAYLKHKETKREQQCWFEKNVPHGMSGCWNDPESFLNRVDFDMAVIGCIPFHFKFMVANYYFLCATICGWL